MAGDKRYRPNVDYTVATQTSIDGHAAFTPDVNATVAGTADATIVEPLGSSSAATSVSTTASTEDVARIAALMTNAQFLANLRSTAAFTSVNSAAASTTILASNANRKGAIIVNTDANILYLDLTGGTAALTRYAKALATGDSYQVPFGITGLITGIWGADGAGAALVTEAS